eukprot:SAG31_NODE_1463_length_8238_cov_3.389851_9_plen_205_part_00
MLNPCADRVATSLDRGARGRANRVSICRQQTQLMRQCSKRRPAMARLARLSERTVMIEPHSSGSKPIDVRGLGPTWPRPAVVILHVVVAHVVHKHEEHVRTDGRRCRRSYCSAGDHQRPAERRRGCHRHLAAARVKRSTAADSAPRQCQRSPTVRTVMARTRHTIVSSRARRREQSAVSRISKFQCAERASGSAPPDSRLLFLI